MDKSKISIENISIKQILDIAGLMLNAADGVYIFENEDLKIAYKSLYMSNFKDRDKRIKLFLIENQKYINKEKFILLTAYNYSKNLQRIQEQIDNLAKASNGNEISEDVIFYAKQKAYQEILYKNTLKLGRDLRIGKDICPILGVYEFDKNRKEGIINFIDSREIFQGKKINRKKNIKRFDEVDNEFKEYDSVHEKGLEFVLRKIATTDICITVPDNEIGEALIILAHERVVASKGKFTNKQLQDMKINDRLDEYYKILSSLDTEDVVIELKNTLREYSAYLDLDKLLLISAYRYTDEMESRSEEIPEEFYNTIRGILVIIRNNIKNKNTKIHDEIKHLEDDGNESEFINYDLSDLDETIERFVGGKYITREQSKKAKEKLLNGEITFNDLSLEEIHFVKFKEEDLHNLIEINAENAIFLVELIDLNESGVLEILYKIDIIDEQFLAYLIQNKRISTDSLISLYMNNKVSIDFLKKFSEELEITSEISLKKINQDYLELKRNKSQKEGQEQKIDAMIEIYKAINVQEDTEEIGEISDEVMYEIAEDFEGEEDILFYYENGLVTLTTVADWMGEEYVEKIFAEGKISKDDLMDLFKKGKISNRLIEENFLEEDKLGEDGAYDRLINLINNRGLSESKIIDLYLEGKIFDADFDEMLNNKIISHQRYFAAKDLRTMDKLEENAKIKLSPKLKDIPDKKGLLYDVVEKDEDLEPEDWFTGNSVGTRNIKTLINPEIRYKFIELLGAKQAEVLDIDESNAFYNYDFFVIPNSMGEFDLDSVVIAERFFVDKETKDRFATDNATYFFQYKDLMVNSNMSKNEMTKERDKIVFRASHRSGNWAVSVLQKLAQTMLSTKFEECTTEQEKDERAEKVLDQLHRILTPKQIKEILDLTREIDDEEKYTYELIDGYNANKTKKQKLNDDGLGEL